MDGSMTQTVLSGGLSDLVSAPQEDDEIHLGALGTGSSVRNPNYGTSAGWPGSAMFKDKFAIPEGEVISKFDEPRDQLGEWPYNISSLEAKMYYMRTCPDGYKNKRGQPSLLVKSAQKTAGYIINCGQDFSEQARRSFGPWGTKFLASVLYSHFHVDAWGGTSQLEVNKLEKLLESLTQGSMTAPTMLKADAQTRDKLLTDLYYLFPGLVKVRPGEAPCLNRLTGDSNAPPPHLEFLEVMQPWKEFTLDGTTVMPLEVYHGDKNAEVKQMCGAFLINNHTLVMTDYSSVPQDVKTYLSTGSLPDSVPEDWPQSRYTSKPDVKCAVIDALNPFTHEKAHASAIDLLATIRDCGLEKASTYTIGMEGTGGSHYCWESILSAWQDEPHHQPVYSKVIGGELDASRHPQEEKLATLAAEKFMEKLKESTEHNRDDETLYDWVMEKKPSVQPWFDGSLLSVSSAGGIKDITPAKAHGWL